MQQLIRSLKKKTSRVLFLLLFISAFFYSNATKFRFISIFIYLLFLLILFNTRIKRLHLFYNLFCIKKTY